MVSSPSTPIYSTSQCHLSTQSSSSFQLACTMALTFFSYSRRFSRYSWAASLFAGLFGFGSCNSDYKTNTSSKIYFSQLKFRKLEVTTRWQQPLLIPLISRKCLLCSRCIVELFLSLRLILYIQTARPEQSQHVLMDQTCLQLK